jgi:hypothetical protein
VGDEDYDSDEATQIRHFNSQATSILLASLCREEYNKVQGLKNAKEIWDVLKTAHEGDEVTKITKRETIEGELGRFILNKGEEPQAMYNRLKTMVNQVCNLGSTKWDDHEMVKVILRSLIFCNPTQVQLICGDPRYKQMSPEEVIGKFVSFELMIKYSKRIVNLKQGTTSTLEVQPVAFKATEEKKEEYTPSRLPIDASKLDNEEMTLIIKSFRQILKQRKGKDYKPCSKRVCYRCGKSGHFIAKCPYTSDSDRDNDKKGKKRMEKKRYHKKKGAEAHMGREWDSDESSTDSSSDEDATNIAMNKGISPPTSATSVSWLRTGKKKKLHSRDTPKYTTSDDEGNSSDNNDDLISLFANLTMDQKKKLNELTETINEKDDLLECQEDLVVKENKKIVKLKNAYVLEVEKCENLTKELSMCNNSISCLRDENASLNAKIEELNVCKPSTSTVEHVTICTRCRDVNVEAIDDHLAMIKEQNDHIAKLNAKTVEHELENEKFKFARSMLYNGRHPSIKDGIGFQQGSQSNTKLNAPKKLSNFVKGKAPMVQYREGYILYPENYPEHKIRRIHARKPHNVSHHAFMHKNEASGSRHSTHIKMPKNKIVNAANEYDISFKTFDASYVLTNKSGKVVAKYIGGKHKSPKTCVWVPKVLVSNVKGPKTVWVPKNKT